MAAGYQQASPPSATQTHTGYLWQTGASLFFRWNPDMVEGAIASVTPAPNVKKWELGGSSQELKRGVNVEHELFEGFSNFFRFARKKGLSVTLLQPAVKVVLFYTEEQPLTFADVGVAFDIGSVYSAGFVAHDTDKLDDLLSMSTVTLGIASRAVMEAKGVMVNLSDLPSQTPAQGAPAPPPSKEEEPMHATQSTAGHSESSEEHYTEHFEPGDHDGQGCYLVLSTEGKAMTVARKWSKEGAPEGAVAFFAPNPDKVAPTSWKYNNGGRRVVLMSGAMIGEGGLPPKYFESWVNYVGEARKMGGLLTLLKCSDPAYAVKIIFQKEASELLYPARVGEPIDLADKAVVLVVPESEKSFDFKDMVCGIFMSEGRKLGALKSWV